MNQQIMQEVHQSNHRLANSVTQHIYRVANAEARVNELLHEVGLLAKFDIENLRVV
jgi:hypothetical protein